MSIEPDIRVLYLTFFRPELDEWSYLRIFLFRISSQRLRLLSWAATARPVFRCQILCWYLRRQLENVLKRVSCRSSTVNPRDARQQEEITKKKYIVPTKTDVYRLHRLSTGGYVGRLRTVDVGWHHGKLSVARKEQWESERAEKFGKEGGYEGEWEQTER